MALHELSTNAVKYGALSNETGTISVNWKLNEEGMLLEWRETGGPPVSLPTSGGFGTKLLTRGLLDNGTGRVDLQFDPAGVRCAIIILKVL